MRSDDEDLPRVDEARPLGGQDLPRPATSEIEPVNAHTLTLEFWRFLTEEEWRTVVVQVKTHVPHIRQLQANAVRVTEHQAADAVDPPAPDPGNPSTREGDA